MAHQRLRLGDAQRRGGLQPAPERDEPERIEVVIRAPKDRPSGSVLLRGARIITMKGGGNEVIENGEIRKEPAYLTDFWTDRAVHFIEENRERPFFLYLPYHLVHTDIEAREADVTRFAAS